MILGELEIKEHGKLKYIGKISNFKESQETNCIYKTRARTYEKVLMVNDNVFRHRNILANIKHRGQYF